MIFTKFSPLRLPTRQREKLEGWKNAFLGVVHFNFSSLARSDAKRFVFLSSYPSDASRPLMDVGVKKHFHGIGTETSGVSLMAWRVLCALRCGFDDDCELSEWGVGVNHVSDLEGTVLWGFGSLGISWIFFGCLGDKWLVRSRVAGNYNFVNTFKK